MLARPLTRLHHPSPFVGGIVVGGIGRRIAVHHVRSEYAQKDRWMMERVRTMVGSSARLIICAAVMINVLSPSLSSAASCDPPIAKAMAVEGKVDVRTTDSTQWRPVKLNDTFCPGDVIRVQERSRADIALSNQPMLRLDQNTTMTLGGIKKEGGSLVELT